MLGFFRGYRGVLVMVAVAWLAFSARRERVSFGAAKQLNAEAGPLAGRTAVVVGGTAGIGAAIALRLARGGADVVIVGRSKQRGAEMVAEMDRAGSGRHLFVSVDAMLMSGVDAATRDVVAALQPSGLDFLVFCQTIATFQGRTPTSEGIDQKLALNYYSRVRFILNLLPLLQAAAARGADVRVLSVLSAGVHSPYADYRSDTALETGYSLKAAADAAGFYNDLALDALARAHPNITFVHAAPGFVESNWGTELPSPVRATIRVLQALLGRDAAVCAEFMSTGLLSPTLKGGLRLIGEFGQPVDKTALHTDDAVDFVWKHTLQTLSAIPISPQSGSDGAKL
jgi:NAD(P)-dependent dehydrogenase (short-subunit alcohol dehydrogenase family)